MNRLLNFYCLFFLVLLSKAQFPNSDVWLFKIEEEKNVLPVLSHSLNISNREGYDNQPSFTADGSKIYFVSIKEDKQADIYYYELKSKKIKQLTKSKESEYSPVHTAEGRYVTTVMVEADSSQRIHFMNTELGFNEKKFDFDSVGYYHFLNADTVIYYKLTQPHSLRYYVKPSKEDNWLCNAPVRGFKAINRHELIYGIKDSTRVVFYIYDFLIHRASKYCEYPSTNEDIVWHAKWGLLKSEEDKILRYDVTKKEWVLLFDLSNQGIKKITRFDFDSKNKFLVLVNNL